MKLRAMNPREKRLVRFSAIGIAVYLALFFIGRPLQHQRAEYVKLVNEARLLKSRVLPYEDKAAIVKKLMEGFQMDPAKLSRATVVGDASAAIQRAAMSSGIQVGPIRESPSRASGRELASVIFEGTGQVPAMMMLLKRMENLGYPMIIDSVQLTPQKMGPGMLKMTLTVVILDFEQWKNEGKPHA